MWEEPTPDELAAMPKLQETRIIPAAERVVHLHFSWGAIDYYAVEYDGKDTFWGYVDYHDPLNEGEWTCFSLTELWNQRTTGTEVINDPYWQPIPFSDRPINLAEVDLPYLTLTCGKCQEQFTGRLPFVFAYIKAYPDKTPCCRKAGWFKEKNIVRHINALLTQS